MDAQASGFRHIVFITPHENVEEAVRAEAVARLRVLGQGVPGLKAWTIAESLDTRKGHIIIENALFEDQEAFARFRASEAHGEFVEFLKKIADWLVGDYLEE